MPASRGSHKALGKALAQVLRDRNFVLVASTDLSHFYNQQTALTYDRAMLKAMESFDPEEAFDLERAGKGFACGLGAFTAVMWAAHELGADKVKVLRHATSGNVTGDYSICSGVCGGGDFENRIGVSIFLSKTKTALAIASAVLVTCL